MKCPHCRSLMFIQEHTQTDRSQVIFYRCSICSAEHVSSVLNFNSNHISQNHQKYRIAHNINHALG